MIKEIIGQSNQFIVTKEKSKLKRTLTFRAAIVVVNVMRTTTSEF